MWDPESRRQSVDVARRSVRHSAPAPHQDRRPRRRNENDDPRTLADLVPGAGNPSLRLNAPLAQHTPQPTPPTPTLKSRRQTRPPAAGSTGPSARPITKRKSPAPAAGRTWLLSWGVRLGLPIDLSRAAPSLLTASHWFDSAGSADGGMHVLLEGKDRAGRKIVRRWFIVAREGDGPYIPCAPAVILAKRILGGASIPAGATACVGMIGLHDYLDELKTFNIKMYESSEEIT